MLRTFTMVSRWKGPSPDQPSPYLTLSVKHKDQEVQALAPDQQHNHLAAR